MTWDLSRFGRKLTRKSGILALMDDLGRAMSRGGDLCMMGGGNPARIPTIEAVWRRRMKELLASGEAFDRMLVNYDVPQGGFAFMDALVGFLNREYGWNLTERNVAITNGSQNAFFYLFNLLAGERDDGATRRILLPLCPEYIGYADQGVDEGLLVSCRPEIEHLAEHRFKYHVDFGRLEVGPDIAALCASRPTNPTGNVLTNEEVERLTRLAEQHDLPLILDNAYGAPFPGIIFSEVRPAWSPHVVLVLSLSKLGLPGTRTGIVVAREEIIEALSSVNAIVSLANGNVGQALVEPLLRSGEILRLSRDVVRPFYEEKSQQAQAWIAESFGDDLDYHVHKSEGALFLWLWFRGLPITTAELYERLKQRGVLIVPGAYFFFGMSEPWRHADECIRVNYSQPEATVRKGLRILAEEVRRAYGG